MSHALVTGSAGFIGSTLTDRLLADGVRVTGVDRVSMKRVSRTYEFVSGSYTEASTLAAQLAERDLHPPGTGWAATRLRDCKADDVGPTRRPR